MHSSIRREGLSFARLMMVLGSMAPLFIIWTVRGVSLIADWLLIVLCAVLVVIPHLFLFFRLATAWYQEDTDELVVGEQEDNRSHLLVYLFSMLLPFYSADIGTYRDLAAIVVALGFVVFLFWHLNLHYVNLLFALFDYRVFTIYPPKDGNPLSNNVSQVLITRQRNLAVGEEVIAYRLSNTVYFEVGHWNWISTLKT